MLSKTLALLHRALRVDVRQVRSHLFRGGLVLFVLFQLYEVQFRSWARSAAGLELFGWLCFWNFWFITFAGATFFATAITEEREEQTLGLLKMANIGALSMLSGKWLPRVSGAVLLLSVQFPFTVLAITLGGVLWDQVLAAYWSLLAHLVLVGSVGLVASVVCARSSGACGLTAIAIGAYLIVPWLVRSLLEGLASAGLLIWADAAIERCDLVWRTTGLARLQAIMATNFSDSPFGLQVISNLAAGAALFLVAWLLFGPCTRNEATADALGWWDRLMRLRQRGSRRASTKPLTWKDFQFTMGGVRLARVRGVGYGLLVVLSTLVVNSWRLSAIDLEDVGAVTLAVMLFVLLIEAALFSARVFRDETRAQTWAGLMLLPRSLPQVAYEKLAGCLLGLAPVLAYLLLGAVLAPELVADFFEEVVFDDEGIFFLAYFLTQVFLFLHLTAYTSITVRWSAWPVSIFLAAFVVILWNIVCIGCLAEIVRAPDEAVAFVLTMFGSLQVALVHWLIGQRLATLAGE